MKKKLFVSVMSLVMAIILMTSTSFAWFTVSQQADVTQIDVTMTAVKNIEIALDDGAAPGEVTVDDHESMYNYGGKVSYTGTYTLAAPATYDGGEKTVTYDTNGRTNGLSDPISAGTLTESVVTYTSDSRVVAYGFKGYVRTNVAGTITAAVTPGGDNSDLLGYKLLVGGTASDGSFEAEANTAYNYELILYFDGTNLKASDVASGLAANATVTFTNSAITD